MSLSPEKQEQLDRHYLRQATLIALDRSRDPNTKVSAIIVAPDGRKQSCGYNGFVAGAHETAELWQNRDEKIARVLHAEMNALLNCPFDCVGTTLYCTLHPCSECLKAIIQAGVKRIVHYGPLWKNELRPDLVKELSTMIEVVRYDDDPIIEQIKAIYAG